MSTGKQIGPASKGTTCRDLQRRHGGGRGTIPRAAKTRTKQRGTLMNRTALLVIAIIAGAITSAAFAQKPIVYPAKGQTSQQKVAATRSSDAMTIFDDRVSVAEASR
jgi:hypothetical protein